MRVAVVGQGPSAKDKGAEIDACDFVVRIKTFWTHGATGAGEKLDALAWYGGWGTPWDVPDRPALNCEHWMTHCPRQLERAGEIGSMRIDQFVRQSAGNPTRWLTNEQWMGAWEFMKWHPSTGFVTVLMAINRFPNCELVLHGFDSTHPDLPNFTDARCDVVDPAHNVLLEKQTILKIRNGWWMGNKTEATLVWPAVPDIAGAVRYLQNKEVAENE